MLVEDPLKILAINSSDSNHYVAHMCSDIECVTVSQPDAKSAMAALEKDTEFDAFLMDASPTGNENKTFLKFLNRRETLKSVPLILRGAEPQKEVLDEFASCPTLHYLTQDMSPEMAGTIIGNAAQAARRNKRMQREAERAQQALGCMEQSNFCFNHIDKARDLAYFVSQCFPEPQRVVIGLAELMMNAIEHGVLGISYEEKRDLVLAGTFYEEVEKRLELMKYSGRAEAQVRFERLEDQLRVMIADPGDGFDWRQFMKLDPSRMMDPNGRGIAMARQFSFDVVEYNEVGNMVLGIVYL